MFKSYKYESKKRFPEKAGAWLLQNKSLDRTGLLFPKEKEELIYCSSPYFNMFGYRAAKIDAIRIGFVGLGNKRAMEK